MSGKVTAVSAANIAFVKYWGTKDVEQTLPYNPSISMTLDRCISRTTLEAIGDDERDEIFLANEGGALQPAPETFARGASSHLGRIRDWCGSKTGFRVATINSFPTGAGIASSASGFSALAVAAVAALDVELPAEELSVLARLSGSGSAARSVMGGYVEWPVGEGPQQGHSTQLATAEHWDLRDLIAILDRGMKKVSSLEGHRRATTSPYFETRQGLLPDRLDRVRTALRDKDFASLGTVVEEEAIDLHMIAMTSRPAIYYWLPGTLEVMDLVRRLRREGLDACFTMDAGANVHVICTPESQEEVASALEDVPGVQSVLRDRVGSGPRMSENHLF